MRRTRLIIGASLGVIGIVAAYFLWHAASANLGAGWVQER